MGQKGKGKTTDKVVIVNDETYIALNKEQGRRKMNTPTTEHPLRTILNDLVFTTKKLERN